MKNKTTLVIVSGYFNPIHLGHVKLFKEARCLGDELLVIVNNDKQVKLKGSVPFLSAEERAEIVLNFKDVNFSIIALDEDKTVCESLRYLHLVNASSNIIFANGGDRKNQKDIPEAKICKKLGIKMVFNIGGKKTQSSSNIMKKVVGLHKNFGKLKNEI